MRSSDFIGPNTQCYFELFGIPSAGYSALWLGQDCRVSGRTSTTFEILPVNAAMARDTFERAGVTEVVHSVEADFLTLADEFNDIAFRIIDAEKDVYEACYEIGIPRMVSGRILITDDATSHQVDLQDALQRAFDDNRVDAMIATVGKGGLLCRKL
ncbi:MAG: hypothetical protein ABI298_07945 [Acidimicrobiales bacterium]